jgi:hypothetical protein
MQRQRRYRRYGLADKIGLWQFEALHKNPYLTRVSRCTTMHRAAGLGCSPRALLRCFADDVRQVEMPKQLNNPGSKATLRTPCDVVSRICNYAGVASILRLQP